LMLLLPAVGRGSGSEKHKQNRRADNAGLFHCDLCSF
jgi:hypothetical protein